MAVKRRTKAPAIAVPQSDDAADALLKEYGEKASELEAVGIALDKAVAAAKEEFEAAAKPLQSRLKDLLASLQAYGAAHRDRLTDNGKTKTVAMPSGKMGWRYDPASVKYAKGLKNDDVVENIRAAVLVLSHSSDKQQRQRADLIESTFIRTKYEPNKEAMLARPEDAELIEGVTIKDGDEQFFVEPVGLELAEPKG